MHPVYNTDGKVWMNGERDCYAVSHACGAMVYGFAPQAQCRKVMERLAALPLCPVSPETAQAMNRRDVPPSPAYEAWKAAARAVVKEVQDEQG